MSFSNPTDEQKAKAKNLAKVTSLELQAREMIALYRETSEWDTYRQMVLNVWQAEWSSSLSVESVARVAAALHNINIKPTFPDLAKELEKKISAELTLMVHAKFLRARQHAGTRLYEINL